MNYESSYLNIQLFCLFFEQDYQVRARALKTYQIVIQMNELTTRIVTILSYNCIRITTSNYHLILYVFTKRVIAYAGIESFCSFFSL